MEVAAIPVITFLRDMVSYTKGRRFRLVEKHTQNFLRRAKNQSAKNETKKKVFFIAAVCADEMAAALMKIDDKPSMREFQSRLLKKRVPGTAVQSAMRLYISALLTVISSQKTSLLEKMELEETELLETWCWVYGYQPGDRLVFNDQLMPAYKQKGLDGLASLIGEQLVRTFYEDNKKLSRTEREAIQSSLNNDAAAILRAIM